MAAKYPERIGGHAVNAVEWAESSLAGAHPSSQ